MSASRPANWLKSFEFYATNSVDADTEKIAFGNPAQIDFAGFNNGTQKLLWYPSSVDFTQTLSGPGVPGGSRVQFEQQQDWNTTFAGKLTWAVSVQATAGGDNLQPILIATLDPHDTASVASGATTLYGGPTWVAGTGANLYNETVTNSSLPRGPGKADLLQTTLYPDGSSVSVEKFLVSNAGDVLGTADATSGLFNQYGSYNLELNIQSSLFQGRPIDVLIAPEILSQKQKDAPGPVGFQP
jgi:hypothetical protein